jgi:hypothetical protein
MTRTELFGASKFLTKKAPGAESSCSLPTGNQDFLNMCSVSRAKYSGDRQPATRIGSESQPLTSVVHFREPRRCALCGCRSAVGGFSNTFSNVNPTAGKAGSPRSIRRSDALIWVSIQGNLHCPIRLAPVGAAPGAKPTPNTLRHLPYGSRLPSGRAGMGAPTASRPPTPPARSRGAGRPSAA